MNKSLTAPDCCAFFPKGEGDDHSMKGHVAFINENPLLVNDPAWSVRNYYHVLPDRNPRK
ncbi:MAG TPA: hypothetical protein DCX95_01165 [Elusimicrobia bacterium]|nr:hypothetical protein [Elusimicrobiota bacterium]